MTPLISGSSAALAPKREFDNESGEAHFRLLPAQLLQAEESFYHQYPWCLNPFITVAEAVVHLREEISKLQEPLDAWQQEEVRANVFLLSCGILNAVEDYLHGGTSSFSKTLSLFRVGKLLVRAVRKFASPFRTLRLRRLRHWQENWKTVLDSFLQIYVTGQRPDEEAIALCQNRLIAALLAPLPMGLLRRPLQVPTAFRGQDLTPFDVVKLGQKCMQASPDRQRPVILVGLRTSGSYFAPLFRAYLRTEGYQEVDLVTLRPNKAASAWEAAQLRKHARTGAIAVIVDDTPGTGRTVVSSLKLLYEAGFDPKGIFALLPVHPTCRDWVNNLDSLAISRIHVLSLEPEEWHKEQLLNPNLIEKRLSEYFLARGYPHVRVADSNEADELNTQLQQFSNETRRTHLKRIYKLHLQTREGAKETRFVLAKSVGWGWLAYHAFIAGNHLQQFVPPILGLRDGILFTEWVPQTSAASSDEEDRDSLIRSTASYVATRVRLLSLGKDPSSALSRVGQDKGLTSLAQIFSKAYRSSTAAALEENRIRFILCGQPCPCPTLIDGKMRRAEWIRSPGAILKTDFEHHGMGKNELNVVDPAYDLAEAILHLGLSTSEERQLLNSYVEQCSDSNVEERIFLSKMLAGLEALQQALSALNHPELSSRHQEFNRHYLSAWNFLTLQMTRFCGQHCSRPPSPRWRSPLAILDVDGVLDRRVFGFPSTTAAGIQALSLLHAHDFAVAVNTARSVGEVKEYCQAYGLAGGVAEYGSYLWDAVGKQGRVRVNPKAAGQLQRIREALRQIPGIFVDDAYQYSIRTYTFEAGGSTPLPTPLLRQLLASLKADRLRFQRNQTDTAIVAKEVDKGTGLLALVEWVGQRQAETLAIGDSEADLAMFRVASRCFAPSQISCRRLAERLGCQVSDRAYQAGLLRIVSSLVHPEGSRCHRCVLGRLSSHLGQSAFMQLLEAADCARPLVRLQAIIDFLVFHFLPKRAQGRRGFTMQAIQENGALAQADAKA